MWKTHYTKGFTLIELMVALIVTGIIMSAIATLAFAFSSANNAADDTDRKQAQVRYATMRISEMIRYCKLICAVTDGDLVIWRDDNIPGGEDAINAGELVYIEKDNNRIRMLDFPNCPAYLRTSSISLSSLQEISFKEYLINNCDERYVVVIPECGNVQFQFDESPPLSTFVSIAFELTENELVRQYHIDSALRCRAGHLLNAEGTTLISDDD